MRRMGISDVKKAGNVCKLSDGVEDSSCRMIECEKRERKGDGSGVEPSR